MIWPVSKRFRRAITAPAEHGMTAPIRCDVCQTGAKFVVEKDTPYQVRHRCPGVWNLVPAEGRGG